MTLLDSLKSAVWPTAPSSWIKLTLPFHPPKWLRLTNVYGFPDWICMYTKKKSHHKRSHWATLGQTEMLTLELQTFWNGSSQSARWWKESMLGMTFSILTNKYSSEHIVNTINSRCRGRNPLSECYEIQSCTTLLTLLWFLGVGPAKLPYLLWYWMRSQHGLSTPPQPAECRSLSGLKNIVSWIDITGNVYSCIINCFYVKSYTK